MSAMEGLRKRRTNYFVTVDRATVRNDRMSYRALGLLTYLLDLPEGWDVKSEVLARGEGREGREAVRTGLRELAEQGYYRIERRQARDGKFSMGTSISEEPVPDWVADFHEYGGKPVVVVQQRDGSYRVLHKDGTTTPDGFPHPEEETRGLQVPEPDLGGIVAGQTEDGLPGFGLPGAGFPGPGNPSPGNPSSGFLGVTKESEKEDRDVHVTSERDVAAVDNSSERKSSSDAVRRPTLVSHQGSETATGSDAEDPLDQDEVDRTLAHLPDRLRPTKAEALRLRGLIVQRMQRGWTREAILQAVEQRLRPGGSLDNPCGLFAKILVPLDGSPALTTQPEQPRQHLTVAKPWCGQCDEKTRRPLDDCGYPDNTLPRNSCPECQHLDFEQHMERGAS